MLPNATRTNPARPRETANPLAGAVELMEGGAFLASEVLDHLLVVQARGVAVHTAGLRYVDQAFADSLCKK